MRTDIINQNYENDALSYYSGDDEFNDIGSFLSQYEKEKDDFIRLKIEKVYKNKESYLNKIIYDIEDEYIESLNDSQSEKNVYNFIVSKIQFNEKIITKKIIPTTLVFTVISLLSYFYIFPKTDYIFFCSILFLFPLSFFHVYMSAYKIILKKDKYNKIFNQLINNNVIVNLFYEDFMSNYNLTYSQMKLLKKIITPDEYKEILYKSGENIKYKYAIPFVMKHLDRKQRNQEQNNILRIYNNI